MSVTLFFSVIILLFLTREIRVLTTLQNNAKLAVSTQPQQRHTTDKPFLLEIFISHGKPMLIPQNSEYFETHHCHSELKRKKIGEYMHS